MAVEISVKDFLGISVVIGNNCVVEVRIECSYVKADNSAARQRDLFDEVEVAVPRSFRRQVSFEYDLPRTGKRRVVFREDVSHPITIAEADPKYVVFVGRIPLVIDTRSENASVDGIIIVPSAQQ